ncbi:helix-turn-helix domain-containing protein [Pseudoclavibacter sp. 13-3]|uniref:helix-turn-helix domain-containing protein n=1 Tax=Pseudoclavibacter sp. 13-3 TaxID=2901228 RepID=UPI003FA7E9A2
MSIYSNATAHVGFVPKWTLADRLKKARESSALDQGDLAARMELSRNAVSDAERGKSTPRKATIAAWALATGVDRTWLETGIAPTNDGGGDMDESHLRESNSRPLHYE